MHASGDPERELGEAIGRFIRAKLREHPELRPAALALARMISDELAEQGDIPLAMPEAGAAAAEVQSLSQAEPKAVITAAPVLPNSSPVVQIVAPSVTGFVPLRIGDSTLQVKVNGTTAEIGRARTAGGSEPATERPERARLDLDLGLIQERCRLKAASCRLYVEKRAAAPGSELADVLYERVAEIIRRAKSLPTCFLWVLFRERTQPADAEVIRIAEAYETLAEATAFVQRLDEDGEDRDPDLLQRAMELLAQAGSTLRVLLEATWLSQPDGDQEQVHLWLVQETAARRVYIARHMKLDDPGDPAGLPELRGEIAGLAQKHQRAAEHTRAVRAALKRARYHARHIGEKNPEDAGYDWAKVAAAIQELSGLGLAPSDRRLLEILAPISAPAHGVQSPAELVDYLESARAWSAQGGVQREEASTPRTWSEAVVRVRQALAGRRIVVIGGEPRADARARLVDAFNLSECEWVHLTEHGSGRSMAAPIQRPNTAVVLLLIKLTGHQHADEARDYARRAGVPCISMKSGYNPEQVADAVLEQAAEQLGLAAQHA